MCAVGDDLRGELLDRGDDIGQPEGKAYKHTGVSFWPDYNVTDDRIKRTNGHVARRRLC